MNIKRKIRNSLNLLVDVLFPYMHRLYLLHVI